MENDTHTYKEMYEGKVFAQINTGKQILEHLEEHFDTTYWSDEIGYFFEMSHKMKKDKPTVTVQIPLERLGINEITVAAADCCLRAFVPYVEELNAKNDNRARTDEENGKYIIHCPKGEVLMSNAAYFQLIPVRDYIYLKGNNIQTIPSEESQEPQISLCIKIQVQLPAKKLKKATQMLCKDLPDAVERFVESFDLVEFHQAIALSEKQNQIRKFLRTSEYCAFVGNGSILPRQKVSDLPLKKAIAFYSPKECEIEIEGMRGLGIKRGVTVVTGGGYSGKSTFLDAISAGVYNHYRGDGREYVITDETGMKITAEDGRSVKNVNISPFIKWIPYGSTTNFSTEHASGSTSQAANIMEAVQTGSKLLLVDEDKSATNFMIRDAIMKKLIPSEPITPFTDRVIELSKKEKVSTILVIGGSSEYLGVADKIFMMNDFCMSDQTKLAGELGKSMGSVQDRPEPVDWSFRRILQTNEFTTYPEESKTERLGVSDMGFIFFGDERIDVRMLHHVVSSQQLDAIGFILRKIANSSTESTIDIEEKVCCLYEQIKEEGLECVFSNFFADCGRFLDLPRKFEVLAVLYRMRLVEFQ